MPIILKYVLTNIREQKLRTFLILIAILLSTALFFASNAVSSSVSQTVIQQMKSTYGQATVLVAPKEDAPSPWISEHMVRPHPAVEQVMGVMTSTATFESHGESISFSLFGADLSKLKTMNSLDLLEPANVELFNGNEIIVSENFSRTYRLARGDTLSLKIRNTKYRFKIAAIAAPSTLFGNEARGRFALVPKRTLEEISGAAGKSSEIYIKTTPGTDVNAYITELRTELKSYKVAIREPVDAADIQQELKSISTPFMMISMLVLIMSVFIIYTSFKVMMMERLPVLGTFRSIGATEKMTRRVLLAESMIYGFLGGATGIPAGMGILSLMLLILSRLEPGGMSISMTLEPSNVIMSFALAFLISLASAYIPVRKASKLPLKDLVLGTLKERETNGRKKTLLGLALLSVSVILPFIVPKSLVLAVGALCIFILVTSILFIVPLLVKGFVVVFEGLYDVLFGNEGVLAVKNIRGNDNVNQNIALLALSLSTLLLVSVLSSTMEALITKEVQGSKFEIYTSGQDLDRAFITRMKTVKGVDKVLGFYQGRAKVKGSDERLGITGIDGSGIRDFHEILLRDARDVEPYLKELDRDRNLVVAESILQKFNVQVGESLILDTSKGPKAYKIIGVTTVSPSSALAGAKYVRNDFSLSQYQYAYIKSGIPEEAVKNLKDLYGDKGNYTGTLQEEIDQTKAVFGTLFGIMQGFAVILLIIGIFGIINNLTINFIQRRRAIAMYKSVGMSKVQLRRITVIEAVTSGIFGGFLGTGTTLLELLLVKRIMSASVGIVPMEYPPLLFIGTFLIGVLVTLAGSIAPLVKGERLQIIEAIKFE